LIKILQVRNVDSFVESRRQKTSAKDRKIVQTILDDVRKNGDAAVKKYEQKFNGRKTTSLRVSQKEIKEAKRSRSYKQSQYAIQLSRNLLWAQQRIFKEVLDEVKNKPTPSMPPISVNGGTKSSSFVPIPSVGCYIPGGKARYPSSAIMSVETASLAGVKRIVAVSPPGPDGKIDPMTVRVAKNYGATEIYKVGGAQAIGALAYGTNEEDLVPPFTLIGGILGVGLFFTSSNTSLNILCCAHSRFLDS
jgi:histidinol dehydrogenase